MTRGSHAPVDRLLGEAHAIEVLLADIVPVAQDVELYWQLSADLIILVEQIEEMADSTPTAGMDDPGYVKARFELSRIESTITEISRRAEALGE